jgi:hypothetical protein
MMAADMPKGVVDRSQTIRRRFIEFLSEKRTESEAKLIRDSGLFCTDWYMRQGGRINDDAVVDYLKNGARLGLSPSPLFDTKWYLRRYPDVRAANQNPLVHYLKNGGYEGRDPGPLFSSSWYCRQHSEVKKSGLTPLAYHMEFGQRAGYVTTPLFDEVWYKERYKNELGECINSFSEFVERGFVQGRNPNEWFSSDWCLDKNPEIRESELPALWHYTLMCGQREVDPGPLFDVAWYKKTYPGAVRVGEDPLVEFLTVGRHAGRVPRDPSVALRGAKVAVVVHLFYEDLWPQILEALCRIPIEFDLFVTTTCELADSFSQLVLRSFPRAKLLATVNRGRDIGPFLEAVLKIEGLVGYTAVCKIHTKKGITEPDAWRHILLESVLGSSVLITNIIKSFVDDEKIGIVGSEELYFSGPKFVERNRRNVEKIVHAIFPGASLPRDWGFFAGTMFWIRPSALVELSHVVGKVLTFEQDNSANDGQVAHALERVFGLIPLLQGRKIGLVGAGDDSAERHRLQIFDSLPSPKTEEPVRYLKRRGGELRGKIFVAGKS